MTIFCSKRGELGASEAAYSLLRHTVLSVCGIAMPDIARTNTGKPYFPDWPELHFSLSHTKTHVMAAVSGNPVGVDIETLRPVRPGVPQRVCAAEELKHFNFFELWVLKESFLKVSGETRVDPRTVTFAREDGRIVTPDRRIRALLFETIPGCAAAVCSFDEEAPDIAEMADLSKIPSDT